MPRPSLRYTTYALDLVRSYISIRCIDLFGTSLGTVATGRPTAEKSSQLLAVIVKGPHTSGRQLS